MFGYNAEHIIEVVVDEEEEKKPKEEEKKPKTYMEGLGLAHLVGTWKSDTSGFYGRNSIHVIKDDGHWGYNGGHQDGKVEPTPHAGTGNLKRPVAGANDHWATLNKDGVLYIVR